MQNSFLYKSVEWSFPCGHCISEKIWKPLPFPLNNFDLTLPAFYRATFHSLPPLGQNKLLMSIFAASALCVVCRLSVFLDIFQALLKSAFALNSPRDSCHFSLAESFTNHECPSAAQQDWLENSIMCLGLSVFTKIMDQSLIYSCWFPCFIGSHPTFLI